MIIKLTLFLRTRRTVLCKRSLRRTWFDCIQTRNSVLFKAEEQKFNRETFSKRDKFVGSEEKEEANSSFR